jgi:hypothetical protein
LSYGRLAARIRAHDPQQRDPKKTWPPFAFCWQTTIPSCATGGLEEDLNAVGEVILIPGSTVGQVLVEGQDVYRLSDRALPRLCREQGRFVLQSFNLPHFLTVHKNVEVALNLNSVRGREAWARAEEVLHRVELGL